MLKGGNRFLFNHYILASLSLSLCVNIQMQPVEGALFIVYKYISAYLSVINKQQVDSILGQSISPFSSNCWLATFLCLGMQPHYISHMNMAVESTIDLLVLGYQFVLK